MDEIAIEPIFSSIEEIFEHGIIPKNSLLNFDYLHLTLEEIGSLIKCSTFKIFLLESKNLDNFLKKFEEVKLFCNKIVNNLNKV